MHIISYAYVCLLSWLMRLYNKHNYKPNLHRSQRYGRMLAWGHTHCPAATYRHSSTLISLSHSHSLTLFFSLSHTHTGTHVHTHARTHARTHAHTHLPLTSWSDIWLFDASVPLWWVSLHQKRGVYAGSAMIAVTYIDIRVGVTQKRLLWNPTPVRSVSLLL